MMFNTIKSKILFPAIFFLPLTAQSQVVITGGIQPACLKRAYSETGSADLMRFQMFENEKLLTIHPAYSPPAGMPTVRAWLLEQARQIVADAPVVVRAVPPRPVSLPDMGDKACRDRAKLLIQTLRDAAAANRYHANQPDYISYDIEGFFARMHHPNELQKMLAE